MLFLLTLSINSHAQFRYDIEYPAIGYGEKEPDNHFTQVLKALEESGHELDFDLNGSGYLDSLLEALDISPSSQVLVWSKTSLKQRFIQPSNPRSLFFNDEVYVGFVPGSRSLEIGVMDPALGPVFYDFFQNPQAEESFEMETSRCLRCHDSYSMTGGGVPRFLLSSVLAGEEGQIVSHEINEITNTSTPLNRRWGGWYVTGSHGQQETLGNFIVSDASMLQNPDFLSRGNKSSLEEFVDLQAYPRATSDIVALLVIEHQVEVQNKISRLNFETRTLLESSTSIPISTLDELLRPVLDSLFMAEETALTDEITGSSGYKEYFESLGPKDAQGRSLREFDLSTRVFKYPFSFQIYSPAIKGLADPVKDRLFELITAVLNGASDSVAYEHLNADQRVAIKSILQATFPEVLE